MLRAARDLDQPSEDQPQFQFIARELYVPVHSNQRVQPLRLYGLTRRVGGVQRVGGRLRRPKAGEQSVDERADMGLKFDAF